MAFNTTDGFLKMLSRFRKGQSDAAEHEAMETWYESLDDPDADYTRDADASDKVWAKIHERTGGYTAPRKQTRHNFSLLYRIAAAVVLASGLLGYYWVNRNPVETAAVHGQVMQENTTAKALEILLPDRSRVILEPGARIEYGQDFNGDTRAVQLKGNAFFAVTKNKDVPFIVNARGIRTRVLGTEFTISESEGASQVAVHSGKVQVQVLDRDGKTNAPAGQVVLTANLKATYRTGSNALVVGLVDEPLNTAPETRSLLVFSDSPLKEVIRQLEKAYGVEIRTDTPDIMSCPVTADLSGESLTNQLEIVTSALNARFTVDQQGVQIRGGGCGPLQGNPATQP
jgi:ferric-dicitrate binding protein FerR (iron transport regulator)